MRTRLWYEMTQAKKNERYMCLLIGHQRWLVNIFNIIIAAFSTGGVMGWAVWKDFPLVSCAIVSVISIGKLIQPHILPSEKQIEKLDRINDFYFDFYLQLEKIWYDFKDGRLNEQQLQDRFYEQKQREREINKLINEVHKKPNKTINANAEKEALMFFKRSFNT